jgi:hypothetical protein
MHHPIRSLFILLFLSSAALAFSFKPMTLEAEIKESDLVVIGNFKDTKGRQKSRIAGPKYEWNAYLEIDEVLKGNPVKAVIVDWLEFNSDEAYEPPLKKLWILKRKKDSDSYYVTLSHGSLQVSRKKEILAIIQENGTPKIDERPQK